MSSVLVIIALVVILLKNNWIFGSLFFVENLSSFSAWNHQKFHCSSSVTRSFQSKYIDEKV